MSAPTAGDDDVVMKTEASSSFKGDDEASSFLFLLMHLPSNAEVLELKRHCLSLSHDTDARKTMNRLGRRQTPRRLLACILALLNTKMDIVLQNTGARGIQIGQCKAPGAILHGVHAQHSRHDLREPLNVTHELHAQPNNAATPKTDQRHGCNSPNQHRPSLRSDPASLSSTRSISCNATRHTKSPWLQPYCMHLATNTATDATHMNIAYSRTQNTH
jgi:hypothetical protein